MYFLSHGIAAEAVDFVVAGSSGVNEETFYPCIGDYPSKSFTFVFSIPGSISFTFDLGADYTNRDSAPDALVFGDLNLMTTATAMDVDVESSADNISYTNRSTASYLAGSDGTSTDRTIIAQNVTPGGQHRYWRITFDYLAGEQYDELSMCWLGQKIDPGVYPDQIRVGPQFFESRREKLGSVYKFIPAKAQKSAQVSFEYRGISLAKATEFERLREKRACVVVDSSDQGFMFGARIMFVVLESLNISRTFRESGDYDAVLSGRALL